MSDPKKTFKCKKCGFEINDSDRTFGDATICPNCLRIKTELDYLSRGITNPYGDGVRGMIEEQRRLEIEEIKRQYMDNTTFGISNIFLDKYLDLFDHRDQLDQLQEECSELIQACSKLKRGKSNAFENLKEEMAHVLISSAMVAKIMGISKEDIELEVKKKEDKYAMKDYKPEI